MQARYGLAHRRNVVQQLLVEGASPDLIFITLHHLESQNDCTKRGCGQVTCDNPSHGRKSYRNWNEENVTYEGFGPANCRGCNFGYSWIVNLDCLPAYMALAYAFKHMMIGV